jgi:DNA-directed RNA polymerase subunit RPC12/RpoP
MTGTIVCPRCGCAEFRVLPGQALGGAAKGARCARCGWHWWLSKAEASQVGEPEPDTDPRQGTLL